ncbi:hypothetical protein N2152v2_000984 [Parachlorella kessleri]
MSRAKAAIPLIRRILCSGVEVCSGSALAYANLPIALRAEASSLFAAVQVAPVPCLLTFAARPLSASAAPERDPVKSQRQKQRDQDLVAAEEEFTAITDKIPQRPVTVVEGTSYTLVIIAALGFAAAVIYAAVKELLLQPKEYTCYNTTLDRIKDDPRVTVRLGTPISAYGTESRNRAARQRIPHRVYNDAEGREHVQLQFHARGPSGRAVVNADMYKEGREWRYNFLYLDIEAPVPQQVVLIRPGQTDF